MIFDKYDISKKINYFINKLKMKLSIVVMIILLIIIITICCLSVFIINKNMNIYENMNINSIEMVFDKYGVSENKLYNGKKWDKYRLGDLIRGGYDNLIKNVHEDFPNSIGAKYYSLTRKNNELDILNQIIHSSEFIKYHSPKNTCSLHLRLGDIFSKNLMNNYYYRPISYYENHVIPQLKKYEIKEIYIIAGAHINIHIDKSMEYLINLIGILEKHNVNIKKIRLGNSPDDDFVFMCTSKYFIRSGGGYSKLICKMIKKNNGIVINKW
jgi:hypothetical protein